MTYDLLKRRADLARHDRFVPLSNSIGRPSSGVSHLSAVRERKRTHVSASGSTLVGSRADIDVRKDDTPLFAYFRQGSLTRVQPHPFHVPSAMPGASVALLHLRRGRRKNRAPPAAPRRHAERASLARGMRSRVCAKRKSNERAPLRRPSVRFANRSMRQTRRRAVTAGAWWIASPPLPCSLPCSLPGLLSPCTLLHIAHAGLHTGKPQPCTTAP